jgi:hypothetical protein
MHTHMPMPMPMPMHTHDHEPGTWSGDLIANTTVAKGGEGGAMQGAKMALAACFGEARPLWGWS